MALLRTHEYRRMRRKMKVKNMKLTKRRERDPIQADRKTTDSESSKTHVPHRDGNTTGINPPPSLLGYK